MGGNRLQFTFMLVFLAVFAAGAGVTVRTVPDGKSVAVPYFEQGGMVWVSIPDVARLAGFGQSQGVSSGKLVFTSSRGRVSFIRDNHFYAVDTAFVPTPHPPQVRGAALYLPAAALVSALNARHPGGISWDGKASVITVNTLAHNILSVTTEAKQNGTVATVVLADSLPFEVTYFHPNLLINFNGGKLAPDAVRRRLRAGIIDSAFTVQYDGSAQISLVLNNQIETPHVDYNRATRTLMVAIRPRIEQKRPAAASPQAQLDIFGIRTVVIDPGHGGRDPGAVGPTGVLEKDVVLGIGLELRKMLEKAGLRVFMTRDKDVFIPLSNRTKFANDKKADIFVSIHANAIAGDKKRRDAVRGYKVYFLSDAKNETDKMAAMRENAVIEFEDKDAQKKYTGLNDVLNSLAGAEFLRESQELSIVIEQSLGANIKKIPRQQLGVGQANFWVLNGALMPSVLVEVGFISNSEEETLISDKRIQFQQAAALNEAILQFKKQVETGQ
ncbi:MAG: N-acetylmuramoyl-L-alanine amidase [Chitinispirillia bacterium]|nr:N-acetylmuramoyl-L-alanine amidase [Chitinispirillia bacterium]MCL2269198.1 N-acetylmuramoyl-L-alanine amidase [Chitinispirillia bacterium]